jgi:DNA helicase-2/ATP-dependent DNA helicase PcrA
MQAIFDWQGNELADWERHVCTHFPLAGVLTTPWRWKNVGTHELGLWLLDVRRKLLARESIELDTAPGEVSWIQLDGTEDRVRQLRAARMEAPDRNGSVLIIGKSKSPPSQREFANSRARYPVQ